jgi:hypothetical protein
MTYEFVGARGKGKIVREVELGCVHLVNKLKNAVYLCLRVVKHVSG